MTTLHQEADKIPGNTVILSFVGVALAIIVGTAVAYGLGIVFRSGRTGAGASGDGASRDVAGEIHQVERTLFNQAPGLEERIQALRALQSYGWEDREAGLVHIPIERAMDRYLARHREDRR